MSWNKKEERFIPNSEQISADAQIRQSVGYMVKQLLTANILATQDGDRDGLLYSHLTINNNGQSAESYKSLEHAVHWVLVGNEAIKYMPGMVFKEGKWVVDKGADDSEIEQMVMETMNKHFPMLKLRYLSSQLGVPVQTDKDYWQNILRL